MSYSLSGHLLVASSLVTDPVLAAGVCLVMHQDENRTIGVMLNRPLKPSPEALLTLLGMHGPNANSPADRRLPDRFGNTTDPSELAGKDDQTITSEAGSDQMGGELIVGGTNLGPWSAMQMIHFGGPLSGPVLAIHQASEFAEAETGDGIYVAAQKQILENLVRQHQIPYRLIVGHLGWRNEQLEDEIEAGFWHPVPATAESVFASPAEMWPRIIRRATSRSVARWIGVPDQTRAYELN